MARKIKFIQVNVFKGKFLGDLVEFLKKEDADFITMQEVSAGSVNLTEGERGNLFDLLRQQLRYEGVFHSDVQIIEDTAAKFGNAVFSVHPILSSKVVVLNTFRPVTWEEYVDPGVWANFSRHMLDAVCDFGGVRAHVISVHGRRLASPVDNPETTRQANLMVDYLRSLEDDNFIVGGDFNMPPNSQVIKILSKVATNLMENSGIGQTLNPKVHELGDKGYLVDYIFTSKRFKLLSLKVPQMTVSDHLPVIASLELLF